MGRMDVPQAMISLSSAGLTGGGCPVLKTEIRGRHAKPLRGMILRRV